jgi:hypothetical protein
MGTAPSDGHTMGTPSVRPWNWKGIADGNVYGEGIYYSGAGCVEIVLVPLVG